MTIYLKVQGKGLPVVLFHGWGFDHRIWMELVDTLQNQYCFYLVDLPGFHHSPLMDWLDFKQKLLSQLPAQFALLGWSMGGLFAMRLAAEEPKRVTHLINVATSPRFVKDKHWPGIQPAVLDNFFLRLLSMPEQTVREFIELQLQQQVNCTIPKINPAATGLKAGLRILAEWDLRQALHQFTQPTCFMFGRLDTIIPKMTMQTMQMMHPNFEYVLFNKAAHMPFLSHKVEFITHMEHFLG